MNQLLDFLDFIDMIDRLDDICSSSEYESSESESSEPELEVVPSPKSRILRKRSDDFTNLDDVDFFKRYRMCKSTVLFVLHQVDHELEFVSDRNHSVAPIQQLLIAQRFYATGAYLKVIGNEHGVSAATVSRIIGKVSIAIAKLRPKYVNMPSTEAEIKQTLKEFHEIAGFPSVIGTIGCLHVKIQSPGGEHAEGFRNRKGYYSINIQTISDARSRVRNIVARWPGSVQNSKVFTNSLICKKFEMRRFGNSCLLGDSGYPLKNYLLTPYSHTHSEPQQRYNNSHISATNTIQRQHRLLKLRFPILAVGMRINVKTALHIVVACCVLHNICIDRGEEVPPSEFKPGELEEMIDAGQIDQDCINNDQDALN